MANLQRLRQAPGLTPENLCIRLTELAREVPADQAIVEIGVYKGRTLCYLAHGARQGQQPHVYGIDPWDLPGNRPPARLRFTDAATRLTAERTVRQQGMRHHTTLIQGFSTDVAASWAGPPVGLLYVDGDHSYEAVKADVEAWLTHLAEGAVVAFDDYGVTHNPQVPEAVDQLAADGFIAIEEIYEGQLAIATVTAGAPAVQQPQAPAGDAIDAGTGQTTGPDEPLPEIPNGESEGTHVHQRDAQGYCTTCDAGPPSDLPEPVVDNRADTEPVPEPQDRPEPPPRTGKGSGVEAWREYASAVTGAPVVSYVALNRAEIIDLLEREGVIGG